MFGKIKEMVGIKPKIKEESAIKDLVKGVEEKRAVSKLKDLRDPKMIAAIEFLATYPGWQERLGKGELSVDTELSAQTIQLVEGWMANPIHHYNFDEKKHEGFWETEQMKEKRGTKEEFENEFGFKIEAWNKKGYAGDKDQLAEEYIANPNGELKTTSDMKIVWDTNEMIEERQEVLDAKLYIENSPTLKLAYDSFKGIKDKTGNDMQKRFIDFAVEHPKQEFNYNKFKDEFTLPKYESFN